MQEERFELFDVSVSLICKCLQKIKSDKMISYGLKGSHVLFMVQLDKEEDGLTASELSLRLKKKKKKITHDLNDFIADAFKYVSGSIPKADLEVFYRTLFTISENLFSFADQLAAGQVTG